MLGAVGEPRVKIWFELFGESIARNVFAATTTFCFNGVTLVKRTATNEFVIIEIANFEAAQLSLSSTAVRSKGYETRSLVFLSFGKLA